MTIILDPAATNHPFGVWDYCSQRFLTKPGEYTVCVGNSADGRGPAQPGDTELIPLGPISRPS